MNMPRSLAIDTNVLVGIVDGRDKFSGPATELALAAVSTQAQLFYFDCVVIEAIGVLCRRFEEQQRNAMLPSLLTDLDQHISPERITWVGGELRRMYGDVVALVRQTQEALNFNDAWIALLCREFAIDAIASFDQDFDQIPWLKRVTKPEDL